MKMLCERDLPKTRQYPLLLVAVPVVRGQLVPVPRVGRLPHVLGHVHKAGVPFPAQNTKDACGGACRSNTGAAFSKS